MAEQPVPDVIKPSDFQLMLPEVRANPYPYYEVLRREAPVHPLFEGAPVFALSRYRDVEFALHHPELFSSTAFQTILQGGGAFSPRSASLAGHRLLESGMMISVDPPDHGRLRRIANRGFTPRRIAALEPRLRELAEQLVDAVLEAGEMDVVRDLAVPLPITVIAELLGIERDRLDEFKEWSDTLILGLTGPNPELREDEMGEAADAMADYIESVARERRREPREDLVSVLVEAEEGDALTTGEVMSFVVLLLIAGNETTTNLIGNATRTLLEHPDQLELLAQDPGRVPAMLEEALRYESPIQVFPRQATQDVELPGGTIPKSAMAFLFFGSANRDEEQFEDAASFDIGRNPQHLAFGHGIHFCLGASLARLEAKMAFDVLLECCRNWRHAGDRVELVESILLRGPKSLPMRFDRV